MAKRSKRLEKGIESLKEEIKKHFKKLETDILENNVITARYHIKEIDKSLIARLETKMQQLDEADEENKVLIKNLRSRLEEVKKRILFEE